MSSVRSKFESKYKDKSKLVKGEKNVVKDHAERQRQSRATTLANRRVGFTSLLVDEETTGNSISNSKQEDKTVKTIDRKALLMKWKQEKEDRKKKEFQENMKKRVPSAHLLPNNRPVQTRQSQPTQKENKPAATKQVASKQQKPAEKVNEPENTLKGGERRGRKEIPVVQEAKKKAVQTTRSSSRNEPAKANVENVVQTRKPALERQMKTSKTIDNKTTSTRVSRSTSARKNDDTAEPQKLEKSRSLRSSEQPVSVAGEKKMKKDRSNYDVRADVADKSVLRKKGRPKKSDSDKNVTGDADDDADHLADNDKTVMAALERSVSRMRGRPKKAIVDDIKSNDEDASQRADDTTTLTNRRASRPRGRPRADGKADLRNDDDEGAGHQALTNRKASRSRGRRRKVEFDDDDDSKADRQAGEAVVTKRKIKANGNAEDVSDDEEADNTAVVKKRALHRRGRPRKELIGDRVVDAGDEEVVADASDDDDDDRVDATLPSANVPRPRGRPKRVAADEKDDDKRTDNAALINRSASRRKGRPRREEVTIDASDDDDDDDDDQVKVALLSTSVSRSRGRPRKAGVAGKPIVGSEDDDDAGHQSDEAPVVMNRSVSRPRGRPRKSEVGGDWRAASAGNDDDDDHVEAAPSPARGRPRKSDVVDLVAVNARDGEHVDERPDKSGSPNRRVSRPRGRPKKVEVEAAGSTSDDEADNNVFVLNKSSSRPRGRPKNVGADKSAVDEHSHNTATPNRRVSRPRGRSTKFEAAAGSASDEEADSNEFVLNKSSSRPRGRPKKVDVDNEDPENAIDGEDNSAILSRSASRPRGRPKNVEADKSAVDATDDEVNAALLTPSASRSRGRPRKSEVNGGRAVNASDDEGADEQPDNTGSNRRVSRPRGRPKKQVEVDGDAGDDEDDNTESVLNKSLPRSQGRPRKLEAANETPADASINGRADDSAVLLNKSASRSRGRPKKVEVERTAVDATDDDDDENDHTENAALALNESSSHPRGRPRQSDAVDQVAVEASDEKDDTTNLPDGNDDDVALASNKRTSRSRGTPKSVGVNKKKSKSADYQDSDDADKLTARRRSEVVENTSVPTRSSFAPANFRFTPPAEIREMTIKLSREIPVDGFYSKKKLQPPNIPVFEVPRVESASKKSGRRTSALSSNRRKTISIAPIRYPQDVSSSEEQSRGDETDARKRNARESSGRKRSRRTLDVEALRGTVRVSEEGEDGGVVVVSSGKNKKKVAEAGKRLAVSSSVEEEGDVEMVDDTEEVAASKELMEIEGENQEEAAGYCGDDNISEEEERENAAHSPVEEVLLSDAELPASKPAAGEDQHFIDGVEEGGDDHDDDNVLYSIAEEKADEELNQSLANDQDRPVTLATEGDQPEIDENVGDDNVLYSIAEENVEGEQNQSLANDQDQPLLAVEGDQPEIDDNVSETSNVLYSIAEVNNEEGELVQSHENDHDQPDTIPDGMDPAEMADDVVDEIESSDSGVDENVANLENNNHVLSSVAEEPEEKSFEDARKKLGEFVSTPLAGGGSRRASLRRSVAVCSDLHNTPLARRLESTPQRNAGGMDDPDTAFKTPLPWTGSVNKKRHSMSVEMLTSNPKNCHKSYILKNLTPEERMEVLRNSPMIEMTRGSGKRIVPRFDLDEDNLATDNKFEVLMSNERTRLTELCTVWKCELEIENSIPEEVQGQIRVAIGKAELLIKERFSQFGSLIQDHLTGRGDRPVNEQDLQGFWEMIYPQVTDVDAMFTDLSNLKANNWIAEELPSEDNALIKKKKLKTAAVPIKKLKIAPAKSNFAKFREMMNKKKNGGGDEAEQQNDEVQLSSSRAVGEVTENEAPITDGVVETVKVFDAGFFRVDSPLKSYSSEKVRKSLRRSELRASTSTRVAPKTPLRAEISVQATPKQNSSVRKTPKSVTPGPVTPGMVNNLQENTLTSGQNKRRRTSQEDPDARPTKSARRSTLWDRPRSRKSSFEDSINISDYLKPSTTSYTDSPLLAPALSPLTPVQDENADLITFSPSPAVPRPSKGGRRISNLRTSVLRRSSRRVSNL